MDRKRTSAYIWTAILGGAAILGFITDGFTVWDRFNDKETGKEKVEHPIIDLQCEPLRINAESAYDQEEFTLSYKLQTSNGTYQIIDSIRIDTLIILQPEFFFDIRHAEKDLELNQFTLDKRILNSRNPEQKGVLKLQMNCVFAAEAIADLYSTGKQVTIAQFRIGIPYTFNNRKYRLAATVPVIIYDSIRQKDNFY